MREARSLDYADDGRVQINVGIKDAEDFFTPYSYKTYELLNPSVVDYINMCEASIPQTEEISLDVYTENPTTNAEKTRIRKSVKRYHAEQIVIINSKLKKNLLFGLASCFIGVALLVLEAFFFKVYANVYLDTIMAVVGWLFLWDGLEIMLSERSELIRLKIRSLRLMNAKVHVRQYDRKIQREYGFGEYEEDEEDDE